MAQYLLQVASTPDAWAAMVKTPQDRSHAVEGPIQETRRPHGPLLDVFRRL